MTSLKSHSEPIDFPTDIVHDGIDYYLDGSIDDGPWDSEMGIYYTDDAEAPDQVLHLPLTDALRKCESEDGGRVMLLGEKINWVHWALQEAINGNTDEAMLEQALELVEDIRERIE